MILHNLNYPLDFKFKLTTLASDFNITDVHGRYVCYVRQKMFRLKEDVLVYTDESRAKEVFRIQANQWLDFNAAYTITSLADGQIYGKVARKGLRSLWKATYQIADSGGHAKFTISEDNPWIELLDGIVGEIPVIGMFTGYFLNPSYSVKDLNGKVLFQLQKKPSFFGRRFQLHRFLDISDDEESLVVLSLLMMVLLERSEG